jgi:1-acyl-sn-glycerol-3-phosphate acyltransferase
MMLALRSLLFNIAFYINLLVWVTVFLPAFVFPRKTFFWVPRGWARSSLWLLKWIAGTRLELRGVERIPPGGLIVAAKHQSAWETFAMLALFEDPAFIMKRELMWIPGFGWYAWKGDMIGIDRKAGSAALIEMSRRAKAAAEQGRQIIIYPEGTRRAPGAPAAYKFGIAHLYTTLGVPCLPVALNSGLFWPRHSFLRRPGTIVVEFSRSAPARDAPEAFFEP